MISIEDQFQAAHESGWHAALYIYGLRDCTIRNDSESVMRFPVGRHEAYVDLDPGEQITLRTVEPDIWGNMPCRPHGEVPTITVSGVDASLSRESQTREKSTERR